MAQISLPAAGRRLEPYTLEGEPLPIPSKPRAFNRVAFSAAHVVADPLAAQEPSVGPALDWDATLAYRRYLLGLGLGIAEAMDTAQRGMGLDWNGALELIRRTLAETRDIPNALIYSGCGTDQLHPVDARSVDDVLRAYEAQLSAIQKLDGRIILMASRALVRVARGPEDYLRVYRRVLDQCDHLILHWLGEMFDPALDGYWGARNFDQALDSILKPMGITWNDFKAMNYVRGEVKYYKYKEGGFSTPTRKFELSSTVLEKILGARRVFCGTTPSFFCLSSVSSRSLSQP